MKFFDTIKNVLRCQKGCYTFNLPKECKEHVNPIINTEQKNTNI